MIVLMALAICENLLNAIINEKVIKASVHSVFDNACNLEAEGKFITLLSSDKKMSPMSIAIDNGGQVNFKELHLTQGLNFMLDQKGINCREKNLYISLKDAKKWFPGAALKSTCCSQERLLENIGSLEAGLKIHGKLYGIAPLVSILVSLFPGLKLMELGSYEIDRSLEFIKDRFVNFIKGVMTRDEAGIAITAGDIIGFGVGLTPAMDDFIAGIMIALVYLTNYYGLCISETYEFNSKIIKIGANKTTRVSSEMLRYSSMGQANEPVRSLMKAILSHNRDGNINQALIDVIGLGETSGTDTVLGIYMGCKILTNTKYRRVWLNESMC